MEKQTLALARLLDHGYKVDLQAQQLAPAEDAPESEEAAALRAAIEHGITARDELRSIKLTGKPILGLPEPADEGDARESDGDGSPPADEGS